MWRYHTQKLNTKVLGPLHFRDTPTASAMPWTEAQDWRGCVRPTAHLAVAAQEPAEGQLAGMQPVRRNHTQELDTKVPGPSLFRDTPAAPAMPWTEAQD